MEKSNVWNDTQKVIEFYRKLSFFIFKYWFFIVILFLSNILIISWYFDWKHIVNANILENQENVWELESEIWYKKSQNSLIWNSIINLKDYEYNWLNVDILKWRIFLSWNLIYSENNLLTYSWLVFPINTIIDNWTKLNLSLSWWDYNIDDLKEYMKIIVNKNSWIIFNWTPNLLKDVWFDKLEDKFWLWCIYWILNNNICEVNINRFLNDFYKYDISNYYDEILKIVERLDYLWYNDQICDWFMKYIYYSNNINEKFKNIFMWCSNNYWQILDNLISFNEISNLFKNNVFTSKIYSDKKFNNFKLISYQNYIYNDLMKNKYNPMLVSEYINFLKENIKNNWLDKVYFDISYFFNKSILKPKLDNILWSSTQIDTKEMIKLIESISKLNSESFEYWDWLESKVSNKSLITALKWISKNIVTTNFSTKSLKDFFVKYVENFSFFKIKWNIKEISKDEIVIDEWEFTFIKYSDWKNITYNIKAKDLLFFLDWIWTFYIKDLKFQSNPELQSIIDKKLKPLRDNWKWLSLNGFKDYLDQFVWISSIEYDLCSRVGVEINNAVKLIWTWSANVISCNDSLIRINSNDIDYKLWFKAWKLSFILIWDKSLEKKISEQFKNKLVIRENIPSLIAEIIKVKIDKDNYENVSDFAPITNLFKKYFWVDVKNISKDWKIYNVWIDLEWINFEIWLDAENDYNINSIYILPYDQSWKSSKKIKVSNFSLKLNNDYISQITFFKQNTLKFIYEADKTSLLEYFKEMNLTQDQIIKKLEQIEDWI